LSNKPLSGDRLSLEVLDTLGTIYRSAGRFDQAALLFEEAVKRYAKEPQVLLHLGRAYAGRKQYAAASAQLNLAAALADEKALAASDAEQKAKYQACAAEARRALKELPGRS
jgi:tetratricopeptide (TPR) repeat protein